MIEFCFCLLVACLIALIFQDIIDTSKRKFGKEPDALIGIHGRFTDYKAHLNLRGARYASKKFYMKAIQYFRYIIIKYFKAKGSLVPEREP